MSEEEFCALEEVIVAQIRMIIEDELGRDNLHESVRYSELRQDFIDKFIFGE